MASEQFANYLIEVDTTDLAKSKRHAGQLGLDCTVVAQDQHPTLSLQGPRDKIERFLHLHCGDAGEAREYFKEFALRR
jgi:hypothetical protein